MADRDDEFCSSCPQRHDCKEVYERLGRSDAPPVLLKVVVAMVLPLVAFVAAMAAVYYAGEQWRMGEGVRAAIAVAAGAAAGFLVMLAGRWLARRFGQEQGKV